MLTMRMIGVRDYNVFEDGQHIGRIRFARSWGWTRGPVPLLERGLFQEQGMMQRAVDEIEEDIWFLTLAVINNDITSRHTEYLQYFYAEEFADQNDVVGSRLSRGMVKRDKIRTYVHGFSLSGAELGRANEVGKTLTKAYSGYVHGASPHIMDMYFQQGFDVSGALKHYRYAHTGSTLGMCTIERSLQWRSQRRRSGMKTLFSSLERLMEKVDLEMHS